LEPKPEKNQGDFSRAIEAFSGQMMECYWVISQLALCSPLSAWLVERGKRFPDHSETALFLNSHGQRLSIRSIDLTLRRLGKEANVAVSAHRLRHSCLTNLVRRGHDLVLVAEIAGHNASRPPDVTVCPLSGIEKRPWKVCGWSTRVPRRIFTPQERKRLDAFPSEIAEADLIRYFTLSRSDLDLVRRQRGDQNRIGFALQLCALRYMGFCPDDLEIVSTTALAL
jgi:hypothetical protein